MEENNKNTEEMSADRAAGNNVQQDAEASAESAPAVTEKGKSRAKRMTKPKGALGELLEWLEVLVIAAAAALFLNNFIIANSTIPTGSMENTIMTGSRVFGSRLKYTFGDVERGDVAIFVYGYKCRDCGQTYRETDAGVCPNCGRADAKNQVVYYVKRVIGMPGDHIEIKKTADTAVSGFSKLKIQSASGTVPTGTLYINGEAQQEVYLPEPMITDGDRFPEIDVTVPEGCYYMLGDNRNNSADARYWGDNNFVKRSKMKAKVYVKYWPLSEIGRVR